MVKYYSPQVTKLKNGKYKYSIRYRDPSFTGIRKKSVTITKNTTYAKTNAEKIVKRKIEEQLGEYSFTPITCEELGKNLINLWEKNGISYKTRRGYRSTLNNINKTFGKLVVSQITTVQINRFINDLLYKYNLSNSTAHVYFNVFSQIFNYAKQFGYTKTNIMNEVKVNYKDEKAKKRYRVENWYLTDKEVKTILDLCVERKRPEYANLFLWMYLTGMRIGEACAIQIKNVHVEGKTYYVDITGTMISVVGHGEVKQFATKTAKSYRTISLPEQAVQIFKLYSKNKKRDDFLFTSVHSQSSKYVINSRTVEAFLRTLRPHTHIKKHVTSHIFRHTHVSKLAELGFPLSYISKRVGHESEGITRDIYLHVTERAQKTYDSKIQKFKF